MREEAGEVGDDAGADDGAGPVLDPAGEATDGGGGLDDESGGGGGGDEGGGDLGDGTEFQVEELLRLVPDDLVLHLPNRPHQRRLLLLPSAVPPAARGSAAAGAQPLRQLLRPANDRRRRRGH